MRSPPPFCKRADHSLCDDFDELPLGSAWSSQHVSFATLSLDDASAVSAPSSLLAIDPTGPNTGAYASASITITLDGTTVLATSLAAPASTSQTILFGFQEYFGTLVRARYDDVACDVTP